MCQVLLYRITESVGYVTKDLVSNGGWVSWCIYEGVDYPQEVLDLIDGTEVDSENDSGEHSAEN